MWFLLSCVVDWSLDCSDSRFRTYAHNKWYQSVGFLGLDCAVLWSTGSNQRLDSNFCRRSDLIMDWISSKESKGEGLSVLVVERWSILICYAFSSWFSHMENLRLKKKCVGLVSSKREKKATRLWILSLPSSPDQPRDFAKACQSRAGCFQSLAKKEQSAWTRGLSCISFHNRNEGGRGLVF